MKKAKATHLGLDENYWGRRTDAELLERCFTTDDPESLAGLVDEFHQNEYSKPFIEMAYDLKGTKRSKIRCVHCKHTNHYKGYVVKVDGSTRFLCGHTCGNKIYGANFDVLQKDFERARARLNSLRRMENLKELIPEFCEYLFRLRTSPEVSEFKKIRIDLREKMPRLHGALETVTLKQNMQLFVRREERDYEAENRADERYDRSIELYNSASASERLEKRMAYPSRPIKPVMKQVEALFGSIPSPTLFTRDCFEKADLDALAAQFENLKSYSSMDSAQVQNLSDYRLRKDKHGKYSENQSIHSTLVVDRYLRDTNTLLDKIEVLIDKFVEMIRFFERNHLSVVAEWATQRVEMPGTYSATGNRITYEDVDGVRVSVELPSYFKIPNRGPLKIFREAINTA